MTSRKTAAKETTFIATALEDLLNGCLNKNWNLFLY